MKRARLDPKRPGKLLPSEHQIQSAYFDWVRKAYPGCKLIYAVPNGSNKSPVQRVKFQREGLTPGIPDVNIDVANATYHGARIEFKTHNGKVSVEQTKVMDQLRAHRYRVVVCRSVDEAIEFTSSYLFGVVL